MKKILIVATVQSHICQFHKPIMKMLKQNEIEVHVAAKDNLSEKNGLYMEFADKTFDIPFERSPFSKKNLSAYNELKKIIDIGEYDVIQCNTPVGGVLARIATKKYRKNGTRVIYMAHGFHFYKGAPIKNWIFYYPIEKKLSKLTDVLITINQNDYKQSTKFNAKENILINGVGIDVEAFSNSEYNREEFRKELKIPKDSVVVLSVGELNKNKNSETLLKAASILRDDDIYFCIAGNGPLERNLQNLAKKLKIEEKVRFCGYRRDVANMCKSSDVFCLLSKREGLGIVALEAMACGLPIITSRSGGILDYSEDGKTGFNFEWNDVKGIASGIKRLAQNKTLRQQMADYNKCAVLKYDVKSVVNKLKKIYIR